jgi:hypothetical protein
MVRCATTTGERGLSGTEGRRRVCPHPDPDAALSALPAHLSAKGQRGYQDGGAWEPPQWVRSAPFGQDILHAGEQAAGQRGAFASELSVGLFWLTILTQLREGSSRIGCQAGKIVADCVPEDVQTDPVVGVPKSVAHAADIAPRLVWHQFDRMLAQPDAPPHTPAPGSARRHRVPNHCWQRRGGPCRPDSFRSARRSR